MANSKITGLTALADALASGDLFEIVDVSSGSSASATASQIKTFCNNGNTIPSTGSILTNESVITIIEKTIDADSNTISNLANASIKSNANIDVSKIGTGIITTTVFNYLSGVSSNIQTQIDNIGGSNSYYCSLSGVSDVSTKQLTFTEAQIQTAIGLTNSLSNSISLLKMQITVIEETTGSNYNLITDILTKTSVDNSVLHISDMTITASAGSLPVILNLYVSIIDAS